MLPIRRILLSAVLALGVMAPTSAYQTAVDQADPSVVEQELRSEDPRQPQRRTAVPIARPQAGSSAIIGEIVAGAIRIEGASALPPPAFADVIERYVGRTLSGDDLSALASDVANVARAAGYGLATAWVPEQRLDNAVLHVILDEGSIDAVEISGNAAEAVRPFLAPLAGGRPVTTATLERQLVLAGDLPGVRMGKAKLQRRGGKSILTVNAVRDRVRGHAAIDNWGSSTVGPVRARLTADINGIMAEDDRLTIGGIVTPLQPKEFALARLSYTKVLGTSGTELTVGGYVAYSEPGGILKYRDIRGKSAEIEFGFRHPILRSRSASLWGSLDFRLLDSSQTRADVKVRDDRIATLSAGLFAVHRVKNSRARARVNLIQGLDVLDATVEGDPLASRFDGSGVFTKVEFWGEYEQQLGAGLSLLALAEGQVANRPLLSSEEMGLGGRYFGRAWDYREFSGDQGYAGSLELRFDLKQLPSPAKGAQLYTYVDAGKVTNLETGLGGGSLASAGGGVRLWFGRAFEASLEAGFPLSDGANPAEDKDPRLSFTLGTRF